MPQGSSSDEPLPSVALSGPRIRRLLGDADRLSFGVAAGFVRINRDRLLAEHGITEEQGRAIDEWVLRVGGTVQTITQPAARGLRRQLRPRLRGTTVWELPARALDDQADA